MGREFASVLFDVFLAPATSPCVLAARKQGRRYAVAVEQPGHGLGAPCLYVLGAILDWLATALGAETVHSNNFQQYEKMDMVARGDLVRLCKVAKVYQQDQVRLVFCFGHGPEALALRARVMTRLQSQEGFVYKQGKAPPSHMERALSSWPEQLIA